jgi:hypothetical protein
MFNVSKSLSRSFSTLHDVSSIVLKATTDLDSLVFHPPRSTYKYPDLISFRSWDGIRLSGVFLENPKAKHTILYSYGNGESLEYIREDLESIRGFGFSVFGYDYRGYGESEGKPSEEGVYRDIEAAYHYLIGTQNIPFSQIIAYGRSVGSGPTIDLASRYPLGGLIVEGAFTSLLRIFLPLGFLPFDKFINIDKIRRVKCPTLVIHSVSDKTIPINHGKQLYRAAPIPKYHFWALGTDHNDLQHIARETFAKKLIEFSKSLKSYHHSF